MKKLTIFSLLFSSWTSFADVQNPSLIKFLSDFYKDTKKTMGQKPFKSGMLRTFDLNEKKYSRKLLLNSAENKEEMFGINSIQTFFYGNNDILTNAFEIDEKPLKTVKLIEEPWSGYFWSMANGLLGFRYEDEGFDDQSSWEKRLEYVTRYPSSTYNQRKIELLSPSEKYDLLIGNSDNLVTKFMWNEGKKEIETYKKIRDWSGLCHGLAMASIKYPWPKYSIKLKTPDGKNLIKFFPDDIKALGVFIWSGDNIQIRKLGGRCELVSPRTDENGRIKDPNCRDPNPGAFHLALVNRIGVQKKSLIMDSSGDAEVWNYPIVSYNFNFFNPETWKKSFKLKSAMIHLSEFSKDKFREYRSTLTEYIVGVEVKIDYLTHRDPKHSDKDPDNSTSLISVLYRYDLEIDANGKIIGGEWYSNYNPDFIWFPEDKADPQATFDHNIHTDWNPATETLPQDWLESANFSAERGQVSSNIIKALFEYSNKGTN